MWLCHCTMLILGDIYLSRSEITESNCCSIPNILRNIHTAFQSALIFSPPNKVWVYPFLHILPNIYCYLFLDNYHFGLNEIKFHFFFFLFFTLSPVDPIFSCLRMSFQTKSLPLLPFNVPGHICVSQPVLQADRLEWEGYSQVSFHDQYFPMETPLHICLLVT